MYAKRLRSVRGIARPGCSGAPGRAARHSLAGGRRGAHPYLGLGTTSNPPLHSSAPNAMRGLGPIKAPQSDGMGGPPRPVGGKQGDRSGVWGASHLSGRPKLVLQPTVRDRLAIISITAGKYRIFNGRRRPIVFRPGIGGAHSVWLAALWISAHPKLYYDNPPWRKGVPIQARRVGPSISPTSYGHLARFLSSQSSRPCGGLSRARRILWQSHIFFARKCTILSGINSPSGN